MKGRFLFFIISCAFVYSGFAQSTSGQFTQLPNQLIFLEGFEGIKSYLIDSTRTDQNGNFSLHFTKKDYGVGYLKSSDNKPLFVILADEDIEIKGQAPGFLETLVYTKGTQNIAFSTYASDHPIKEQVLNAWNYLEKMYASDPFFTSYKNPLNNIKSEKQRIIAQDVAFLNTLPKDSYVRWFIPIRKLVSSVSVVAQYRPEEIPATRNALRQIDYADPRLYKSGLFKEAIENHVWFIENSSGSLETVYAELNTSIDLIINQLKRQPERFNEVTNYLFNLLEQHSLLQSAEYLALKVLNDDGCTLDNKVASKLESYRAMRKGNVAPDITFGLHTKFNQINQIKSLQDIQTDLKLVIFAAGWCSHCQEILPKIVANYPQWKLSGMEVILVTLDGSQQEYDTFTKDLPFIATSELNVWEGKTVKDYHVFATPTMFLLDKDLKILLKPISVEHVNSYFEFLLNK